MLEEKRQEDAIAFLRKYQPNNISNFNQGGRNIVQIAVEQDLHEFLNFLLKDHKVLSCIARASRPVSHSYVVNNAENDNIQSFKNAASSEVFQFLWSNYSRLLTE
jgi:hypothetical protein